MDLSPAVGEVLPAARVVTRPQQETVLHRVDLPTLDRPCELGMVFGVHVVDLARKYGFQCHIDRKWQELRYNQSWQGSTNKRRVALYRAGPNLPSWKIAQACVVDAMSPSDIRRPADTRTLLQFANLVGADDFPYSIMGLGSKYNLDPVSLFPLMERSEGVWHLKAVPFPERSDDENLVFLTWF